MYHKLNWNNMESNRCERNFYSFNNLRIQNGGKKNLPMKARIRIMEFFSPMAPLVYFYVNIWRIFFIREKKIYIQPFLLTDLFTLNRESIKKIFLFYWIYWFNIRWYWRILEKKIIFFTSRKSDGFQWTISLKAIHILFPFNFNSYLKRGKLMCTTYIFYLLFFYVNLIYLQNFYI